MIRLILHLWSKLSGSKMFGRAPKKSFFLPSLDHILVNQCRADRKLVTLWCMT